MVYQGYINNSIRNYGFPFIEGILIVFLNLFSSLRKSVRKVEQVLE